MNGGQVMSADPSINIIVVLIWLILALWVLRWAWHRFLGAPLDPAAERERLRRDIGRSYRLARWIVKRYFRR